MPKLKPFVQFTPDPRKSDTGKSNPPGTYGWGFETNGYRIVMYGPQSGKFRNYKPDDHGPAHIHVIDIDTQRESKFQLIEHYRPPCNDVRLMPPTSDKRTPLKSKEIDEIIPILELYSSSFIQLWRELYQDRSLSSEVTRVSEKFPDCEERVHRKEGEEAFVRLKNRSTGKKTYLSFQDYVDQKPEDPEKGGRS